MMAAGQQMVRYADVSGTDGSQYLVSYTAGDGNDVQLTLIPEQSSFGMLVGSLSMLLGLQRFRRRR